MGNTVWVLTSEHNDYDQHGAYFEAVFAKRPSVKELAAWFKKDSGASSYYPDPMAALEFLLHVHDGGGRQATENVWYNLEEITLL